MTRPTPHPATRIATVDVGSNTVLLLVADVARDGSVTPVYEEDRFARLGEGVDRTGRLSDAAMERAMTALRAYREKADALGAEAVVIGATSASRDAANTPELARRVRDELGLDYRVIAGETEAELSFRGAASAFPQFPAVAVLDVGGGSAEIVRGTASGMDARRSLNVGAVRLTERCFAEDGVRAPVPTPDQIAHAASTVDAALDALDFDLSAGGRPLPLLGASGTARTLGILAGAADPLAFIPAAELRAWRDRLLALTPADTLALSPGVMAGREDVFAAGVLVVERVVGRFGLAGLWPSPRGLRHGLALQWATGKGRGR